MKKEFEIFNHNYVLISIGGNTNSKLEKMPAYLKTFDNVIIFPFAAEKEKIGKENSTKFHTVQNWRDGGQDFVHHWVNQHEASSSLSIAEK